jgi:hypothetical protein
LPNADFQLPFGKSHGNVKKPKGFGIAGTQGEIGKQQLTIRNRK